MRGWDTEPQGGGTITIGKMSVAGTKIDIHDKTEVGATNMDASMDIMEADTIISIPIVADMTELTMSKSASETGGTETGQGRCLPQAPCPQHQHQHQKLQVLHQSTSDGPLRRLAVDRPITH